MYLRGMSGLQPGPDSADGCGGATPCGFSDWFSMSQPCAGFIACSDPSFVQNASALANNPGIVNPLTLTAVGEAPLAGQTLGSAANAAAALAANAAAAAAGGLSDTATVPGMLILIALGVGAVLLLPKLVK